ncbi:Protein of unknown function (DUF2930) [Seminavis robusta]|uniref:Uncharacterized protein n=1 Tax=Seminavis robusta TaxID=568900 RepID=A0A9N8ET59_9STRA|nr:Protein of unknown function (DUF2930) [Seminavis robusta]|eukprot:Sro1873_g302940.1 Protein of unknown function (DUF2930) (326) ;mRNA; f:18053-19030
MKSFGFWNGQLMLLVSTGFLLAACHGFVPNYLPSTTVVSHGNKPPSRTTRLYQSDDSNDKSAKVRFSGASEATSTSNPIDSAISLLSSDVASIGLGLVGLCLLSIERLTLPDAATLGIMDPSQYAEQLGEETRSNLIAVIACGSVLLNGLSKLDVTSALAEEVTLEGVVVSEPVWFTTTRTQENINSNQELDWAMESFLKATPAKSVAILQHQSSDDSTSSSWQVAAAMGTLPDFSPQEPPPVPATTPILDRSKKSGAGETYLPTLQALPGKTEFTYLPANTQGVLILPIPNNAAAIVLGSNCAKSFTPRDVAWCQTIAGRLGTI